MTTQEELLELCKDMIAAYHMGMRGVNLIAVGATCCLKDKQEEGQELLSHSQDILRRVQRTMAEIETGGQDDSLL